MTSLLVLHRLRPAWRVTAKILLVAVTVLLVCYPDPRLLVAHVSHWMDVEALIDPAAPELEPLLRVLDARVEPEAHPQEALRIVERAVYEQVPYAYDWDAWRVVDYLPTVSECLKAGRDDCDGQAVVAASLLRRLGFQATLATDLAHVWVVTEHGETMRPHGTKAIAATGEGLEVSREVVSLLPRSLAFGIALFPLTREAIVVFVLWYVLLRPGLGWRRAIVGLVLLVDALLILRAGSVSFARPDGLLQGTAILSLGVGLLVLLGGARPRGEEPANTAREVPSAGLDTG